MSTPPAWGPANRRPTLPCAPGELHPAYEPWRATVTEWLDYPARQSYLSIHMTVPSTLAGQTDPTHVPDVRRHLLERRVAWGKAPYVGRAFVYVWDVGVDELGRMVAGEATLEYSENEWQAWVRENRPHFWDGGTDPVCWDCGAQRSTADPWAGCVR